MSIVNIVIKYIIDKRFRFLLNCDMGIYSKMDDVAYLTKYYYYKTGQKLNLDFPKLFSEKMQWLKLYDRQSRYTTMVDKYAVKQYVSNKIGEQYIIPTIGVWERFEDIDFDVLPNQFVLKCTHDSHGVVICRDKASINYKKVRKKLCRALRRNYYAPYREWPYKNVKPRIIAEQYMKDADSIELRDYKFYCFGGNPLYCQVISNRTSNETVDFFDMNWKHQDFTGLALPHKKFSKAPIPKPINLEKMKEFACVLSENIPFLRVDFYEVNGKLYFGELTFYPASGFGEFYPTKWNEIMGDHIILPEKREYN